MEKIQAPSAPGRIVALNATGGNDHGPEVLVDGAIAAMKNGGARVVVVGDPEELSQLLYERACFARVFDGVPGDREGIERVQFPEVPVVCGSTIKHAALLVAKDIVDALASGGKTQRMAAVASRRIGLIPNVTRPAIIADAPRLSGIPQTVLDVGGMPDDSVRAFIDRAFLGVAMAKANSIAKPRVGLMNMGKESNKGPTSKKLVYEALEKCAAEDLLDFAGNVEGDDVFGLLGGEDDAPDALDVDVILTDAPEGNEMLKLIKKFSKLVKSLLRNEVFTGLRGKAAGALVGSRLAQVFAPFRSDLQSSPVVGVKKSLVAYHGSSKPGAVEHAIYRAARPPADMSGVSESIARACELLKLPLHLPKRKDEGDEEDR